MVYGIFQREYIYIIMVVFHLDQWFILASGDKCPTRGRVLAIQVTAMKCTAEEEEEGEEERGNGRWIVRKTNPKDWAQGEVFYIYIYIHIWTVEMGRKNNGFGPR